MHTLKGPTAYSPTSSKLIKFLATIDHHDTISYAELTRVAGRDVRAGHDGYCSLQTAIRAMQRDEEKLFKVIPGEGVKLLTADEAGDETHTNRLRIGKATRKASRRGQCVKIASMSDDKRTAHLTNLAQLSAMAMFSNHDAHHKLLPAVNGSAPELNPSKLLEVFKK